MQIKFKNYSIRFIMTTEKKTKPIENESNSVNTLHCWIHKKVNTPADRTTWKFIILITIKIPNELLYYKFSLIINNLRIQGTIFNNSKKK